MQRRTFLTGAAIAAASSGLAQSARAAALEAATTTGGEAPLDLRAAARAAFIYFLPLLELSRFHAADIRKPEAANVLTSHRTLRGPESRQVTTPNNDTLYTRGWLDLSRGPVDVVIPPTGDRYICVAFRDMFTNNFAVLGTRTTGGGGAAIRVVGPDAPLPPGALRSPHSIVWLSFRILVDGPQDLEAARKVQDAIVTRGPPGRVMESHAGRDLGWEAYLARAQQLIDLFPPPVTDIRFFRSISALRLQPGGAFRADRFSERERQLIGEGFAQGRRDVRDSHDPAGTNAVVIRDGWRYPARKLGVFDQDYFLRADFALHGIGALPNEEAMYFDAVAPDGSLTFDSDRPFRLRFAPDRLPPVNAFWSLSMYEATPERQSFFTPNGLNRYSIGDRTPGLRRNDDGSLDIWIGRNDPGDARRANWLPAPQRGPFTMMMRAYLPKPQLLNGLYTLPAIEAT